MLNNYFAIFSARFYKELCKGFQRSTKPAPTAQGGDHRIPQDCCSLDSPYFWKRPAYEKNL